MSRTYREALVSFCSNCDKPANKYFGYTVSHGDDICSCRDRSYYRDLTWYRKKTKVYDTRHYYSVGEWKKIWNRKQRFESKNILRKLENSYNKDWNNVENYDHPLDNYTFPISKNQAAWDAY